MTRPVRVLSLYEGFFAGGARILHSDVVAGLHASTGQRHSILSIASTARRESTIQRMQDDPRYRRLAAAGVEVHTLGHVAGSEPPHASSFSDEELRLAARSVGEADVILSLKEQPLAVLVALQRRGMMPEIPVAVCLHRSDPLHSGAALTGLIDAAATGLVTTTIACADSTSVAYARAGVDVPRRFVIANGIDLRRFRPGTAAERAATRAQLGIPASAPVILLAARFDAMKDPGLFLEAVSAHAADAPGAHYVVCGAGMTWDNPGFRALAAERGIRPGTPLHALGIVDDMPAVYRIADVVALTSAFGEASPLCLIEGAACGATPVTTNVGDAAHQVAGIGIVTPRDPRAVAAAWSDVLARREELRDAALNARHRFDRARMIEGYRIAVGELQRSNQTAA